MLEQRLRSGEIVTFDGRVLEVFPAEGASERLHVAQLDPVVTDDGGASSVSFGEPDVAVRYAREEVPARDRLLAAISAARRSYA